MPKKKNLRTYLLRAAGDKFPPLAADVRSAGGKAFFVGGCVRDFFLEHPIKDVDVEVYGLTPNVIKLCYQ